MDRDTDYSPRSPEVSACARPAIQRYAAWARQFNRFLRCAIVVCTATLALSGHAAQAEALRVLVLGDSLTAGYGLASKAMAFPARLESRLEQRGYNVNVINGGVSGDTTAGGRARLAWAMGDEPPDVAVVALGANDGLRGLDPGQMRRNLDAIISTLKEKDVKVLLAGMRAPPNFGKAYVQEFDAVFPALAEKHDVAFMPFLLEGVAARPEMNQDDGIHPNEKGVAVMVDRMTPYVVRLLDEAKRG